MARTGVPRILPLSLLVACSAAAMGAQQPSMDDALPGLNVAPSVELSPPRVASIDPKPAHITCKDDQLTIVADNSTLGSILAAVRTCVGVKIDVPDGFADERIYMKLGPGTVRAVLDELLGSTDLNYVIQPSATAPQKLMAVLLMAGKSDHEATETADISGAPTGSNAAMTPARRAWLATRNAFRPEAGSANEQDALAIAEESSAQNAQEQAAAAKPDANAPVVALGANSSHEPLKQNDGSPNAPAQSGPVAAVVPDVAPVPVAPDPNKTSPAAKELQNRIDAMQQMFDQRKKMMTSPGSTPNQN